jgi:uncharacterized protein
MAKALPWRERAGGLDLRVRVTPRASRDAIEGLAILADGTSVVKLRIRAVPAEGAANEAVCKLLAKALRVPPGSVTVAAGTTARIKTISIDGESARLAARLATIAQGAEDE